MSQKILNLLLINILFFAGVAIADPVPEDPSIKVSHYTGKWKGTCQNSMDFEIGFDTSQYPKIKVTAGDFTNRDLEIGKVTIIETEPLTYIYVGQNIQNDLVLTFIHLSPEPNGGLTQYEGQLLLTLSSDHSELQTKERAFTYANGEAGADTEYNCTLKRVGK